MYTYPNLTTFSLRTNYSPLFWRGVGGEAFSPLFWRGVGGVRLLLLHPFRHLKPAFILLVELLLY